MKRFSKNGYDAAFSEAKQLHDRVVFIPVDVSKLTPQERKRAMESLMFLVEKFYQKPMVCQWRYPMNHTSKEDAASPTMLNESLLITAIIEAKEGRDVMILAIPTAFVQTDIDHEGKERIIIKIRGALVDKFCEIELCEIDSELYSPYVVLENGEKLLFVVFLKALYGMLEVLLLFYKKLCNDLKSIEFKVSPYNPRVANQTVNDINSIVITTNSRQNKQSTS
jgi:hypothetical protein